jgi:flagellar basal-body rod protein FlgC
MRFYLFLICAFFMVTAPALAQDDLFKSMTISAYGMKAQGERTRVISENIANASTAPLTPEAKPYTRKIITFENDMDRKYDTDLVKVKDISDDKKTDYILKYMPDHPGANAAGYVKMPNVNMIVEMNDMREAQRSYEANLGMMEQSKNMSIRTIELLR